MLTQVAQFFVCVIYQNQGLLQIKFVVVDGHTRPVLIVQLVLRVLFRLVLILLFLVAVLMDIGIQEVLAQVIIYTIYIILYIYIYIGCGWKCETCASASSCSTCIVQAGVNISLPCDCNDGFWDDGASCSSTYILIYIYIYIYRLWLEVRNLCLSELMFNMHSSSWSKYFITL